MGPAGARVGSTGVDGQGGNPPNPTLAPALPLPALPLPPPPPSVLLFFVFRLSTFSCTGLWGWESSPSDMDSWLGRGCSSAWMGLFRTRMSLRMRILMPWSAREQERGVDSVFWVGVSIGVVWERGRGGTYPPYQGTSLLCIHRTAQNRWIGSVAHCCPPLRTGLVLACPHHPIIRYSEEKEGRKERTDSCPRCAR